ncbi:MAG: hypothetical protein ABJK37_08910 [Paraglaciecola sp.]|uniref:hypothetical protein n=1 Tax=Paraglaciecola sp. TaxID=1920173 RepID=UPI00329A41E7
MWTIIIALTSLLFVLTVTWLSYYLGRTKTENPIAAGVVGFLVSFVPPIALVYLVVLSLKEEVATV